MPRPYRSPAALLALAAACLAAEAAPGQAPRDQLGDPLPPGAVARIGTSRWRHSAACFFVGFLPDGKTVVTAGGDNLIRVWEFPSGKEIRRFGPGAGGLDRLAFGLMLPIALSSDGKHVACDFDGDNIVVHEVATGKEIARLPRAKTRVQSRTAVLDFSPDGKQLAAQDVNGNTTIWDWAAAKEVCTLPGPDQNGDSFVMPVQRFNKDGTGLLTVHGTVNLNNNQETFHTILHDPTTGKELWKATKANVGALGADFSADGKLLALANEDGTITIADAATGKELRSFGTELGNDVAVRFGPGGILFTLDRAGTVTEWDPATGKQLRALKGDGKSRPDRAGFAFGTARLAFAADGKTLALCDGSSLPRFLDIGSGKAVAEAPGPDTALVAVQFSPDGKLLWTRGTTLATETWDARTGKAVAGKTKGPMVGQPGSRSWLSPDGKILAQFNRGAKGFQLLDTATGNKLASISSAKGKTLVQAAWAGDGKTIALRWPQANVIELCEVPSLKVRQKIAISSGIRTPGQPPGRTGPAPATMLLSADGSLLAAYSDSLTFTVWDTTTARKRVDLRLPEKQAAAAGVFTADERSIALTVNDGTVLLHELATGEVRRVYGQKIEMKGPRPPRPVSALDPGTDTVKVALSPDGKRLAAACPDDVVRVWDLATGKELAACKGHTGTVHAVAFSPDGTLLASASADTTALVWDMAALPAPPPGKGLTAAEVEARWALLVETDAGKAFDALCELAASPKETTAFLAKQLRQAERIDPKLIDKLIADLDSTEYKVRSKASAELLKLGEVVVPTIDKALATPLPLETKTRLENLRTKLSDLVLTGERLRAWRAVELLERIGTPEAREVLQILSVGAPGALLTEQAKVALKR